MEACRHNSRRRALWPYLLTSLLALLAGMGALAIGGITPFGEASLCWQDNGQQVSSDFGYVRGLWEGRHSLDWSFACGGSPRSSFHPTFNNLCSPLTWAVAAIPGISAVTGLSFLFLLQLMLLPLGALFYLRRRFPRLSLLLGMALALAYAFGGFVLSKHTFLPFLNIAILFPWYVAALDSLLKRGRWLPCTLLLGYMLAVGTYFAYMWLLFAALCVAARAGWRWQSPVRQHSFTLVAASAGALLLSAIAWLPSLLVTLFSARAGEAHFWWNATRAEFDGCALAYVFSLPFLLAAALGGHHLRRNRYWLVLLVLAVGLFCVSATTLWHLSRPWDFAGRFGYMADFMLICVAAEAAQRRCRSWRYALPLVLVGGTLLLAGSFLMDRSEGHRYQASAERVQLVEWAAEQVPDAVGRATSRGHAAVENLAFFTPFDSLSHFTACITQSQEETLARWGYQQRTAVISTEGGTLATDTLLGMRYILSQGGVCRAELPLLALQPAPQGVCRVQENPYYFGMGLMMPPGVFPLEPVQDDPIGCQQKLLGRLLGEEYAGTRATGHVGELLQLPPACLSYLQQPEAEGCEPPPFRYEGDACARWGGVEQAPRLWELPAGNGVVVHGSTPADFSLYHLPLASLERLRAYAQELPVQLSYAGRRMVLTCRSSESRPLLFLPLLWQAGYEAMVDGVAAPVQNLDGWVGIPMPQPGEHRVELRYEAPGKLTGLLVSAAALPLLLGAGFLSRRRSPLAAQGVLNTLCRRAMLLLTFLLLLWPLLTLPLGLFWR